MSDRRLALVVAVDRYDNPALRRLASPTADAAALVEVLGDPDLGGFHVEVLSNPTLGTTLRHVEDLFADRRPSDLVVLHFSCHGLKDASGELYLATTDTFPERLASTAIGAEWINRVMQRSRAQRIVLLLDCCYGGAFERGVIARAAADVDIGDQFHQSLLGEGRGRAVITASTAMEFAFEGSRLADGGPSRPSVFTGALVEGIRTGEADRNHDGYISLDELYDYVYDQVRAHSPHQTPSKWEFGVRGGLYIARNPRGRISPLLERDDRQQYSPPTPIPRPITIHRRLWRGRLDSRGLVAVWTVVIIVLIVVGFALLMGLPSSSTSAPHVEASIPVAISPSSLVLTPDGRHAYVSHLSGPLLVIDTARNAVTATIDVGAGALGVAITPDGRHVYVAHISSATMSVIDTATNTITATANVGRAQWDVKVTPDGRWAYVTNRGAGMVSVINTATNAVATTVAVGGGPADNPVGVALTPDGRQAYVTNRGSNTVSVINTATNTVTATIDVQFGPNGVTVAPDGRYAYVTNEGSATVSVIETTTNAVTATINVGNSPITVAVAPDSRRAYVVNRGYRALSIIDTATNTVTATVDIGGDPGAVVVTRDGRHAYVTNTGSSTISVIDTAT